MCLNQITIPSTSRYISLTYHDRFLNSFACGHCVECEQLNSLQWSFRANYEFDALPNDGYVMFDCLSYRDKDLPKLSEFWTFLSKKDDYPCFNRKHIRNFLQSLRQRVIRNGYRSGSLRYYYACEYGTSPGRTHRPHIHLMFFCDPEIDKLWLSRTIADLWKYGRTDGIPYKRVRYVMDHNVVGKYNLSSRLRTISYITKYLQKSCMFQETLNKRVAIVMRKMACYVTHDSDDMTPNEWLESEIARRERLKLLRFVNQFHRTSQQFGATALGDFDFNELVKTGAVIMPNSGKVKIAVPLSQYYKRKMFYDKVIVNGSQYWQLNDLGREFVESRKPYVFKDLVSRFNALLVQAKIKYSADSLANYVLNERGFIRSFSRYPSFSIVDRYNDCDLFNYSTCSDKLQFGVRGLSPEWLGDSQQGYTTNNMENRITIKDFVSHHVFLDQEKEGILKKLESSMSRHNQGKQELFQARQRVQNLAKMLS